MTDDVVDDRFVASILREAVEAFSKLDPQAQQELICLLRFLSLPEESSPADPQ